MNIDTELLESLEQLALAATQGPWVVDPLNIGAEFNVELPDASESIALAQQLVNDRDNQQRRKNAAYIAAANPKTILELIGLVKSLNLKSGT